MSYDPQQVGHYGKLVEAWAADHYGLDLDYPELGGLKFDATGPNGAPWEVKGSMVNGVRPTFKFWKDQHQVLREHDGGYVLVWYRAKRGGVSVKRSRSVRSRDVRITNWTNPGATHHRSHSEEAQIPADDFRP